MYTFNQFQVETYVYHLYNYFINEPESAKNGISEPFQNDAKYNKLYNIENLLLDMTKAVAIGGLFFSLPLFIATGDFSGLGLNAASLVVNNLTKEFIRSTKDKEISRKTDVIYNKFVEMFANMISFTQEHTITDDQIHEMSFALVCSERDEKYADLSTHGKCPILLYKISHKNGMTSECTYPITDAYLSRMYEIVMNLAYDAGEGYEELVKEGYNLIRAYVQITEEPNHEKEELDKIKDEMSNYEAKVAGRYR